MTIARKLALAYAVLFLGIAAAGSVPAFKDDGNLFGLFSLQGEGGGLLHALSGLWALVAALLSRRQSVLYARLFGPVYLLDGVLGLITGSGCLDGGIFVNGFRAFGDIEFPARFFANLPHIVIGGLAVWVGFVLASRSGGRLAAA